MAVVRIAFVPTTPIVTVTEENDEALITITMPPTMNVLTCTHAVKMELRVSNNTDEALKVTQLEIGADNERALTTYGYCFSVTRIPPTAAVIQPGLSASTTFKVNVQGPEYFPNVKLVVRLINEKQLKTTLYKYFTVDVTDAKEKKLGELLSPRPYQNPNAAARNRATPLENLEQDHFGNDAVGQTKLEQTLELKKYACDEKFRERVRNWSPDAKEWSCGTNSSPDLHLHKQLDLLQIEHLQAEADIRAFDVADVKLHPLHPLPGFRIDIDAELFAGTISLNVGDKVVLLDNLSHQKEFDADVLSMDKDNGCITVAPVGSSQFDQEKVYRLRFVASDRTYRLQMRAVESAIERPELKAILFPDKKTNEDVVAGVCSHDRASASSSSFNNNKAVVNRSMAPFHMIAPEPPVSAMLKVHTAAEQKTTPQKEAGKGESPRSVTTLGFGRGLERS